MTNETATQFSNDRQLIGLYYQSNSPLKKAKKIKTTGYLLGGAMVLIGTYLFLDTDIVQGWDPDKGNDDHAQFYGGILLSLSGIGVAVGGHIWAKKMKEKETYSVHSTPIFQQEFNIGKNDRLMVGVDILKDNTRRNHTLGLGVSYNF